MFSNCLLLIGADTSAEALILPTTMALCIPNRLATGGPLNPGPRICPRLRRGQERSRLRGKLGRWSASGTLRARGEAHLPVSVKSRVVTSFSLRSRHIGVILQMGYPYDLFIFFETG